MTVEAAAGAVFQEASAEHRVQSLPLAHLSIELGHLYFEDFAAGPQALRRHFREVAPWARAAREICAASLPGRTPRISTTFLVDDYFGPGSSPAQVLPDLLRAADDCGLGIDYLARESGCAQADGVAIARLVEERIVAEPPPGTTGSRPPVTEAGWLCNGQRSPSSTGQAMEAMVPWAPPVENATNRHSIFVDVQLWDEGPGGRTWSCAFLAAVWQLLRLGVLRRLGAPVAVPRPWVGPYPDEWTRLPAVVQLNPSAAPFSAYRALSILESRFLSTEHAVRTILSQVAVDEAVVEQVVGRAGVEGWSLSPELADRIQYVFTGAA
ncbi:MAG: hypothetical protein J2P15_04895 [Micromonosporaceae bacterium]|nr:hypothetical protein [Micromonosporaceae bacterium]